MGHGGVDTSRDRLRHIKQCSVTEIKMSSTYPTLYDARNSSVRKRSAVDAGWQTLTPYNKEARMADAAYPLTSSLHPLIEHDNEIDTAAVAPIVRTILVHARDVDETHQRGEVVWLSQHKAGCRMHHGYRGMAYWEPCNANSSDAELNAGYPFVMAEPIQIKKGACCTVAVALADATVMQTMKKHAGLSVGEYEADQRRAIRQRQYGKPGNVQVLQGEVAAIERHITTRGTRHLMRPLIVTMLVAHEWNKEVSVCIHPQHDRPMLGLYKYK
jgi:hypothetical protein